MSFCFVLWAICRPGHQKLPLLMAGSTFLCFRLSCHHILNGHFSLLLYLFLLATQFLLSHRDDSLFYSLNTPKGWEPMVPGHPPRAGGFPLPSQGCLWLACGAVGVVFSMPRERSRSMRQPAWGHTSGWVSSTWLLLTLKCVFVSSTKYLIFGMAF